MSADIGSQSLSSPSQLDVFVDPNSNIFASLIAQRWFAIDGSSYRGGIVGQAIGRNLASQNGGRQLFDVGDFGLPDATSAGRLAKRGCNFSALRLWRGSGFLGTTLRDGGSLYVLLSRLGSRGLEGGSGSSG